MKLARLFAPLLAALALVVAPASAAFAPTYTVNTSIQGPPGAARVVSGYITLSSTDTYVTGGLTITPASLGLNYAISSFVPVQSSSSFNPAATVSAGNATLTLNQPLTGASNVAATATTAVVTPGVTIAANTPIQCSLNNAATAGGGSGTWAVTDAVSTCGYTSATTFTITVIAAAPTGGGNFTWQLPTIFSQIASGTSVASLVIPFIATGI